MTEIVQNSFGQPIGAPIPNWTHPPTPHREPTDGRFCRLEPMTPEKHATDLFEAFTVNGDDSIWTYLSIGPFESARQLRSWIIPTCTSNDPQFYAILDSKTHKAIGFGSYMRMDPANGCIEVGFLAFSPLLQKTAMATEAMYLMMRRIFELGYRRYEWKCDALNAASRAAAERFGFKYEGTFRQAVVVKGRNRDTAWYSIIESEWPELKAKFEAWLDPSNFDEAGLQIRPLREIDAK